MSTDHNLLFGVLALQADLLDAARFAEACTLWSSRKQTPLADLLVERGWLTAQDRADVDRLVQRKLRKHHGDVRASLAEVSTDEVRHSLAGVADAEVGQSLADMPTRDFPELGATTAHELQDRGRYKLTRLHAQGGIGQVWVARDADLGREVALKELRPERSGQAVAQARFLEEACITGQLEHPGIVPVHELVRGEDGRPFYTMRMVRGRTLAEAIKDYHRKREAGEAGQLQLRGLLTAFVAVCNAVAYAHSRRVLHRDLKPANVVLGEYGEVVVLDWGLAKLMGTTEQPAEAASALPVSVEAGSRDETMQGQVLGTPSYMAPEQAEGRLDLLGPATDVYGLGAVLYEILVKQPPFAGGANEELLSRVVSEIPQRPRQIVPATPAALEAVCLKALAKKPAQRYASAGELAKDVEHWLADEPVTAWHEPVRARAGRWARRHQSLVGGLAAALLVVLLLGSGGGIWLSREQERQRTAAESALERVAALEQQGRWEEARFILEQAEFRLGVYRAGDLRRRLDQARQDLELLVRLEAIRLERATLRRSGLASFNHANNQYAEAFASAGLGAPREDEETVARRVRASPVREALIASLDDWAHVAGEQPRRAWLLGVARRADPDVWRDRLRDPALWRDSTKLAQMVAQTPEESMTPSLAVVLGYRLILMTRDDSFLRLAQQRWPTDFWINFHLGYALGHQGKFQEAEGYSRVAVGLRPDNSGARTVLGWVLMNQSAKWMEAEKMLLKAISLDPNNVNPHMDLAALRGAQGKLAEQEKEYRTAIELDPAHADAHRSLGWVLHLQGNLADGEKMIRRAIELDSSQATSYNDLSVVLAKQGRLNEAEEMLRTAIKINPEFAQAYSNLGWVFSQQGKLPDAEKACRKAIALDPKHAEAHKQLGWVLQLQGNLVEAVKMIRKATELNPQSAEAYNDLGFVLQKQGQLDEAEKMLREAIKLDAKLAAAHSNLGWVLQRQGKLPEAEKLLRKAVELAPKSAGSHNDLGWVLVRRGNLVEAEKAIRTSIDLDPRFANAYYRLGVVFQRRGKYPDAEKLYRKTLELDPKHVEAQRGLGWVLLQQEKWADAEKALRRAVGLDPKNSLVYFNLGLLLTREGKLIEAEKMYRRCIDLDPDSAEAHCNLGQILVERGEFVRALPILKRGHELGSRKPGWTHPSNRWVEDCERLIALEVKLTAFLRGETRPAGPVESLQLAEVCRRKRLYAAAVRLLTGAFAADAKLADDLTTSQRYNAACFAALAACGKGDDAGKLDEKEKARLRTQALAWLRSDLDLWSKKLSSGKPADRAAVHAVMRHWKTDEDFAGVRDSKALAALPEADRKSWGKLWSEVDELIARTDRREPDDDGRDDERGGDPLTTYTRVGIAHELVAVTDRVLGRANDTERTQSCLTNSLPFVGPVLNLGRREHGTAEEASDTFSVSAAVAGIVSTHRNPGRTGGGRPDR